MTFGFMNNKFMQQYMTKHGCIEIFETMEILIATIETLFVECVHGLVCHFTFFFFSQSNKSFSSILYDIRDACIAQTTEFTMDIQKKKKQKSYAHNAYCL